MPNGNYRLLFTKSSSPSYMTQIWKLQKLIAYDHLEGDPGLEGGKNAPLFTDILNMVCNCVDNSSSDRYLFLEPYASLHSKKKLFSYYLFVFSWLQFECAVLYCKSWKCFLQQSLQQNSGVLLIHEYSFCWL